MAHPPALASAACFGSDVSRHVVSHGHARGLLYYRDGSGGRQKRFDVRIFITARCVTVGLDNAILLV